jgi:hypothetical protein
MHDVGAPTPHRTVQTEGASDQPPRSSLDEGKRELRDVRADPQRPWRGGDGRQVAGVAGTFTQGEDHPLSAPDAEFLDHVQDSHQSPSTARADAGDVCLSHQTAVAIPPRSQNGA